MKTLDNCLCYSLETGGVIIGWITSVLGAVVGVLGFIGVILLNIYTCRDYDNYLNKYLPNYSELKEQELFTYGDGSREKIGDSMDRGCSYLHKLVELLCFFAVASGFGFCVTGYLCVRGSKTRDQLRIRPMMIWFAVATVISVMQFISFTVAGSIIGLVFTPINCYCFLVIYSLHDFLKSG